MARFQLSHLRRLIPSLRNAALALLLVSAAGTNLPAQSRSIGGTSVEALVLARSMARHGRVARSPLTLLAAAEILIVHRVRDLAPAGSSVRERLAAPRRGSGQESPERLLTDARRLAGGNRDVLALASALEQRHRSNKGATGGGPRQAYGHLAPGASQALNVDFDAQDDAIVYVGGDGNGPLDLTILDTRGDRIAHDAGTADESVVRWRPTRKMSFRVQIRNRGARETSYVLLTN